MISRDAAYCASKGILYMPTMWPGFSWHNLKDGNHPVNDIPRLGGDFMWKQAYKMISNTNIQTIWMALFDEMDEGTAIIIDYKISVALLCLLLFRLLTS